MTQGPPIAPADRRVRRTRERLRDALVSLVLERGWEAVSVREVCERADIGRSTFYVHFADKEELLLSGFDELHRQLDAQRSEVQRFAFMASLVTHARENLPLFRALLGKRSGQAVQRRFRDVVNHLVEADLESLGLDARTRSWLARYVGGGFLEMLLHWLEKPRALDVGAFVELCHRISAGALARARVGSHPSEA
ncbi:MAG: TetR/AcrR family transcriptional regulator; helix-turn-helix transcriptional regulator [Nannocystaceae bacterium]|nr:TetR/AcrR family transcriptional regulator; helix-turn-helix transcriptional regulator [Nannocystaceae bacterium]